MDPLQLKYLDLYLMHWPLAHVNRGDGDSAVDANNVRIVDTEVTVKETWKAMEKLFDEGKVKAIGVSNFNIAKLKDLLTYARIKPAVNQVELHPYLAQSELVDFCKANDIVMTAFSPLGAKPAPGTVFYDPVVEAIAKANDMTNAQVLISWGIQRGTTVIPKSSNIARIKENFQVKELSAKDMEALNALDQGKRYVDPAPFWKVEIY